MYKLFHELKENDQKFYPITDPEIMKKIVIENQESLENFWRSSDSAKNSGFTIKNYRCLIFKYTKELRIALGEAEISEKFISQLDKLQKYINDPKWISEISTFGISPDIGLAIPSEKTIFDQIIKIWLQKESIWKTEKWSTNHVTRFLIKNLSLSQNLSMKEVRSISDQISNIEIGVTKMKENLIELTRTTENSGEQNRPEVKFSERTFEETGDISKEILIPDTNNANIFDSKTDSGNMTKLGYII